MVTLQRVQDIVYHALPEFYRDKIETKARYAHMRNYKALVFNIYAFFSVILFLFLTIFQAGSGVKIGVSVVTIPIVIALPYMILSLYADRRRKQIEQILPDALNLISSNIESGLTVDKAFLLSARDEFGPLADDLKEAAMEMFGGTPVQEALADMENATNSELFKETLTLLQDGIESGGNVAKLLQSSSEDIRKSLQLRDEIAANVKMYSLFISIASLFGAPVLFSVSVFLTETTSNMWSSDSISFEDLPSRGPFEFQEPSFRPSFFADFSLVAIIITNVFAALIISEIKNGNIREGFKYAPIYATAAVVIFFITEALVSAAF